LEYAFFHQLGIRQEKHLKFAVGGTYSNRPVIFDKRSFSFHQCRMIWSNADNPAFAGATVLFAGIGNCGDDALFTVIPQLFRHPELVLVLPA
jgi:hypothetical protein